MQENQSLMPISELLTVLYLFINIIGSASSNTGFGKAASSTLGRFITRPMTREEACKILQVDDKPDNAELDYNQVMEVSFILSLALYLNPF